MTLSWKQLTALAILSGCLATDGQAQGSRGRALELQRQKADEILAQQQASGTLDATRTKQALDSVLKLYPPSVRQVLQLDTSLLSNKTYLASYPKLAEFLEAHPTVVHDTGYFIGIPKPASSSSSSRKTSTPVYIYRNTEGLAVAVFLVGVALAVAILIRATISHQRWLKLTRAHADTQSKILDRFKSNEELLNFIQTPAGRQFLESSSMPQQPKMVSAPVSQILWSIQIGFVLLCGGIGMEYVGPEAEKAVSGVIHMIGVLIIALGVGFIVSGVSSYVLSRKFGLLNSPNVTSEPPPS